MTNMATEEHAKHSSPQPAGERQETEPMDEGPTYQFASVPSTPKDKPADILVRFQAVSRDSPSVEVKAVYISSRCTLLEARRILHKFFSSTYDRGFIFLQHGKEVVRHKERVLRLIDVMPRLPLGVPTQFFKYPDIQYKRLPVDKDGRRVLTYFAGIVFLCEKSTHERWQGQQLRKELCADRIEGFSFLPANIMSADGRSNASQVDVVCELAALGATGALSAQLEKLSADIITESFKDRFSATPLHFASSNGHVGVAEVIVGRLGRETLYVRDAYGKTPLHNALYNHRMEVVGFLLQLGPDLQCKDTLGFSCSRLITSLSNTDTGFLLQRVEPSVLEASLLLHFLNFAFQTKDIEACKHLCRFVHPVSGPFYRPPLHQAAELGDPEIIELLLQHRPSPRIVYNKDYLDNISILSGEVYRRNSLGMGKELGTSLSNLTNVEEKETYETVESLAKKRKYEVKDLDVISDLEVMLDEVVDPFHKPDVYDSDGHLPFHYACQHGHTDILEHLYFSSMNNDDFVKGVKLALYWNKVQSIQLLVNLRPEFVLTKQLLGTMVKEIGKDLCAKGKFLLPALKHSPLLLYRFVSQAAAHNDTNLLALLLNLKVPMAGEDFMRRSPLHEACQHGHEAAVRFLLLHGADPSCRDWRGATPFHYACGAGQLDLVTVLANKKEVDVAALDCTLTTPTLLAARCKRYDVLLYLVVEHGSAIDLLRHDATGDCVLNYLADFDEDLFNIVLGAAEKHKSSPLCKVDPSLLRPRTTDIDAELLEAWSDPSLGESSAADTRADLQKRKNEKRAYVIKCLKCQKSFMTLDKTKKWSHLCTSPLALPQVNPAKKSKITVSVQGTSSQESTDAEHFRRTVVRLPSQPTGPQNPVVSPLDVLIVRRKHSLIPKILNAFPEYGSSERTALQAARFLDVETLKHLHSAVTFDKEMFTKLFHIVLLQDPNGKKQIKEQKKTVSFLLKMGASPNYIPRPDTFGNAQISPMEMKLLYFMPLEIATIRGNIQLIDLLLENGASASISFALHLAALEGHLEILQKLLPTWKEGRWKPYIKGFKDDANELIRICTLESGLVQAVCASHKCSMELLTYVKDDEKGVFSCKKVLTHHMVSQIRPEICSMTSPTLMNRILYKHAEDVKGGEEICQHLYVTNLLMCKEKYLSSQDVDTYASYLSENGCYLGEIRVSKKNNIHVVCESFVLAVKRRMWKTVESLLVKSGNTLWKCLVSSHHSCHKFAYAEWSTGGYPCLSKGMLQSFRSMPLHLLKIFFDIGKHVMNRQDMNKLKAKITRKDSEKMGKSREFHSTPRPESVIQDMILYHVRNLPSSYNGKLIILCKLTTLFPDIFSVTLKTIRFSFQRYNWFTAAGLDPALKALLPNHSTSKVIRQLRQERVELRLWTVVTTMPVQDVMVAQERELSLLHVACLQNDLRLTHACLTMVVPISASVVDNTGVTPMDIAACRGNIKMLDSLKTYGGEIGPSVLVAACLGKAYLNGLLGAASAKKTDSEKLQKKKCETLDWLFHNMRDKLNLAYRHPDHGTMFDIMLVRHSWTLLHWTLENAGQDTCAIVLSKSARLDLLAYAPEELLRKISHSYPAVIEKMPDKILPQFLLKLSAFPMSRICEIMLKKALALKVIVNQDKVLKTLAYRGSHGETMLHHACRCGNASLVKTMVTIAGKGEISMKEVTAVLDTTDKSGCTPLWYSLAYRYWRLSEFLIVNGARQPLKRAIPGLWNKRMFQEMSRRMSILPLPTNRGLLSETQIKRSNSSNVADIVSPGSVIFRDLYLEDTATDEDKEVEEALKRVEKLRRLSDKDISAPPRSVKARTPIQQVFAQDDMESVGRIPSPVTPRSVRSAVSRTDFDMAARSPRMAYPDDDEDMEVAKENIHKKKRVRYLLALVNFTTINRGTLLHAASSCGNTQLLKGIMASSLWSALKNERKTYSPFIYALANNCPTASQFCVANKLGPFEADPFVDVLCFVIMKRHGFEANHKTLRKLLNRFTIAKETIRGIKLMLLPRTQSMRKLWLRGTTLYSGSDGFSDEYIKQLIQMAIKHDKKTVSNRLLMTMALTGRVMILEAILGVVQDATQLTETFKRKVVHNATVLDLLFLLAPSRLTTEQHGPEYFERMKIMNTMAEYGKLEIAARTLSAATKKNLIPMLEMVVKDHTRNSLPLQPPELWYEAIFKATIKGELNFINTICVAQFNTKPQMIQAAMLRALCLACLKRHRLIANRLLPFKMPLVARVADMPGRYPGEPKLTLECAIEGGDSVIASLILQTMEETGMYPSDEDIMSCIALAFVKGMEAIVDNLLKFAHNASPSLVTLKICHMLFLTAARRGSGIVCFKFLSLPDFNVVAMDDYGFTALHYACMHGKMSLAKEIIKHSDKALSMTTPEGWTPLDLARGFGHYEMSLELVATHGAEQGCGFAILSTHGWLKRFLETNAKLEGGQTLLMSPTGPAAAGRGLDIVALVRQGNDVAAKSMMEIAQESIVACVLFMYEDYPLLHLCAKTGCPATLDILMRLIDAQPKQDLGVYLQKEVDGKIPLCVAIENCNIECVSLLYAALNPTGWRYQATGESLLHFAAKSNKEEIIQMLTADADQSYLQTQDKDGLIPATSAIALGYHGVLKYFLEGLRFAEKLHHEHTTTTYWCVLCLLDCCIGWSRIYLQTLDVSLNGKGRNIFQRHRTESGYSVHSHDGNKAHTGHVLDNIHKWMSYGATPDIQTAALSAMQYSMNGFKSELFLLLSQMTRFEAMGHLIKKGKTEVACYLYEKLCPSLDMASKVLHFINAAAYGRAELVKKILEISGEDMAKINYEGQYTALDFAAAFGHKHLLDTISNAFENSTTLISLKFFDKKDVLLPLDTKWMLGTNRVGDKEWRDSIDYKKSRLSHVDLFLLKRAAVNSFPAELLPRDIMPLRLRGKAIEVNHRSMQVAITELGVDDTYLTSLLVSKAVLGRYYTEIDDTSDGWKGVQKIVLHCVTPSSPDGANTELQWKDLHDTVLVKKSQDVGGSVTLDIITADFPEELTKSRCLRSSVLNDVLPAARKQIYERMYGLDMEVTIDWNTIDVAHDQPLQRQLLTALVGNSNCGPLAGLSTVVGMCSEILQDIEALYNKETVLDMMKMLEPIREIQVKFLKALPKSKDVITLPHDGRITWYFMLDEGRPKYNTSLFSLSILIQMFHTIAVNLHNGIYAFAHSTPQKGGKRAKANRDKKRQEKKEKGITLLVRWKTFMFLNRLKALMHFIEYAVAPQLSLIGAQYKAMLRLEMDVSTVLIKSVNTEDEAGITFSDGVLSITLHSYAITHKPYTVSDIDATKFFNELEVSKLSRKWRTGSVNVTGGRHRAINALLDNIGFPVELPIVGQNVLEMLCRLDSRQMVHPYELLKMFGLALYKNIAQGYIESVVEKLSFSLDSYFVGTCSVPPGLYGWVRQFEVQPQTQASSQKQQLLVYCRNKITNKHEFTLMSKAQVQKQPRGMIAGLWQKISTPNIFETLRCPKFSRGQVIVMNNKAFFITSSSFTENFISSLPEAISVGFCTESSHTKNISFDDAILRPLDIYSPNKISKTSSSSSSTPKTDCPPSLENYDFLCWTLGAEKGFNIVFETYKSKGQRTTLEDANTEPQAKKKLPKNFYIAYATYRTLREVLNEAVYDKQDRRVIRTLFSHIGTISVGPSIPDTCLELVRGEEFDENADVYLVSDRDIHILPLGPLWNGRSAGDPYPQALLVTLCNMFLQQTKSRVSNVLAHNLSRSIDPADIKFRERVTSADQVSSLSSTQYSVKALEKAFNKILSQSSAGTRKLKMDLTGVEFSEHKTGPMVSFEAGVLHCPIFKKGTRVDQRAMERAFLFAVDEEGGRSLMPDLGSEYSGGRGRRADSRFDDIFSVTSSELRAIQQKGWSVLEKQRIVKHHSEDSHVRELAVKRLFSGVEIGRTSDIVDSLDIGANVNSLNEVGETPLIVAAKSRNYTIIDLLLTRGAAPNTADSVGVTPLHYESGQGDVEAVKLMLSYGANPNAEDSFGRTPLHYAVVGAHPETVDLLVFCGADASIVNKDGESPKSLAQMKAIRARLLETDLIIRGIKSGNVAIEHLTLQADTIYKMNDAGLVIRTPSGMGLAKTSLMVRRVVPEYSYYGPQPTNQELLLSDIYDFRISGAYVEEPLLLQIPVYSRVEQYEDIFVKTDKCVYTSPMRVGRVLDAQKVPHWICHARICLYGVRSIVLVARPRAERFKVAPAGLDFKSMLDPMIKAQFRQDAVQEETEVTLQVTSKPSYEEEDYDAILSMSHFYELTSNNRQPLQNDVLVTLPLPENYLGHGILHVLMSKESEDPSVQTHGPWEELLRNPDYARDVVKLRISSWCQLCLLERNPQYPIRGSEGGSGEAVRMVTHLHNKTRKREYSACFLAMAKPKSGAKNMTEAEVVVECIISTKIHARLLHWKNEGFVDLKPSHTMEFAAVPQQAFVIKAGGCCIDKGIPMPPLQFHPKRNNCVRFTVNAVNLQGSDEGYIQIMIRHFAEPVKKLKLHLGKNSRSYESIHTLQTVNTKFSEVHFQDELLSRIPLFLSWTAPPDDPRGQDVNEKINLSPFETEIVKTDIRGDESFLPVVHVPTIGKPQAKTRRSEIPPKQAPPSPTRSPAILEPEKVKDKDSLKSSGSSEKGLILKPGKAEPPGESSKKSVHAGESPKKSLSPEADPKKSLPAGEGPKKSLPAGDGPKKSSPAGESPKKSLPAGESPKKSSPAGESPKKSLPAGEGPKKTSPVGESLKKSAPLPDSPRKSQTGKSTPPLADRVMSAGKSGRIAMANPSSIRVVTPMGHYSKSELDVPESDLGRTPSPAPSGKSEGDGGILDWLSKDLGADWLRLGVLLGVPYASLQEWMDDTTLSDKLRAEKMLHQWKQTRRTRQDHGVPELLMTLQRLGKTELVRSLKDRLRAWISENLERRGCLKGVVNKNLLEDAENLEPMSPLFLLSLVRKIGFSLDFIHDLGLSRPEVSRIMTDPLLRHREDKMLGMLLICRDKESSYGVALAKILEVLTSYGHKNAVEWTLNACRHWLTNHGCADDHFAHFVGDVLQRYATHMDCETMT